MGWNETHLNQTELTDALQVVDYSIKKQTNELESGEYFATVQAMFLVSASWSNNNELEALNVVRKTGRKI